MAGPTKAQLEKQVDDLSREVGELEDLRMDDRHELEDLRALLEDPTRLAHLVAKQCREGTFSWVRFQHEVRLARRSLKERSDVG